MIHLREDVEITLRLSNLEQTIMEQAILLFSDKRDSGMMNTTRENIHKKMRHARCVQATGLLSLKCLWYVT